MNQRRVLCLCMPLILISIVVAAWLVLARRDADFVILGARTVGTRNTLTRLDSTIDAGDFHDCMTVREVIDRLQHRQFPEVFIDRAEILEETGIDRDWYESPVKFEAKPRPMTVKQFLRITLRQAELPNVAFLVWSPNVIATTRKAAAQERAAYLDRLSTYGYAQMIWAEWTRNIEDDDPPFDGR